MLFCYIITLVMSYPAEGLARPRAPRRRHVAATGVHISAVTVLYALAAAGSSRPEFAGLVAFVVIALLAVVSNAKHESLREPFVFTDLSLFSQLFRHPRLYLPFLSVGKIFAILAGAGLFAAAFIFDRELAVMPYGGLAIATLVGLTATVLLSARLPLTLDANIDCAAHGFFVAFVACLCNGLRPSTALALHRALASGPFARTASPLDRPDVIVIQSESFFDARRLRGAILPNLLKHFDSARASSLQHGDLDVPAWGANTMRTEFAILSGLPASHLGYARFYPYAFLRRPCSTLAAWFKRAGYTTTAIHPYHADFFGRDRVFPLMHFDRFIDIKHFAGAPRAGPYVADAAVADMIIKELEAAGDQPTFVMAMTMENHGPLHLEAVEPGEGAKYHALGDAAQWHDLTAYLRHLENADQMIGRLMHYLSARRKHSIVCFYGDHVPALPRVFDTLGKPQHASDYFIWSNQGSAPPRRVDLDASELGQRVVELIEAMHGSEVPQHANEPEASLSGSKTER